MKSVGPCSVDGCDRPRRSPGNEWCEMHYCRVRRNGHTNLLPVKTRGICSVAECSGLTKSHGMCAMHAQRYRTHGDPSVVRYVIGETAERHPSWRGDAAGYSAAHMRLRGVQGSASRHRCTDCGDQAAHWSYDHSDPAEHTSNEGAYSLDMQYYQPRCVPCHKTFDLSHA